MSHISPQEPCEAISACPAGEFAARATSTYDTIRLYRRDELYKLSLAQCHRHVENLQRVIAGDIVIQDADFTTDLPIDQYVRDYAELGDYFHGAPLSTSLVAVTPIGCDDIAQRNADIREKLAKSPFRRRLSQLVEEVSVLLSSVPAQGRHTLPTPLDANEPIDRMVAMELARYQVFNVTDRGGELVVGLEISNETPNETSHFLYTESAAKLLGSFDDAGIWLSQAAKEELALEADHRYGNSFAWLSREAAKSIAGYESRAYEGNYRDCVPEYTGDPGADLLIDVIRQVALRGEGQYLSDIPMTKQRLSLRAGGCKDVEAYFSQSLAIPGALSTVQIAGKAFWYKAHGAQTYINLEPVVYNGVELPPGYLFKQAEDGGYALLRATGFAFDKPTADHVFGVPLTEVYQMQGEEARMAAAFDQFQRDRGVMFSSVIRYA